MLKLQTEVTPVENVVLTTKGLQDRNNLLLNGRTVENKGKLILREKSRRQKCLDWNNHTGNKISNLCMDLFCMNELILNIE